MEMLETVSESVFICGAANLFFTLFLGFFFCCFGFLGGGGSLGFGFCCCFLLLIGWGFFVWLVLVFWVFLGIFGEFSFVCFILFCFIPNEKICRMEAVTF